MHVIYKILIYWSIFGYFALIGFYIWETRFNVKKIGSGFNQVKVSKIHFNEIHYWLIIIACGPAVIITVFIVTVVDYLFYGYREK